LAAYPDFWREHLKLGDDRLIVCGISFGYEDPDHPANRFQTSRADISRSLVWTGDEGPPDAARRTGQCSVNL
jgi:hypothetical protein